MEPEIVITKRLQEQINVVLEKNNVDNDFIKELRKYSTEENIPFRLVKQIHDILSQSAEKKVYLHELIQGSELHLPQFKLPPRNPELEARCQKLKNEQDYVRYKAMVKNVDHSQVDYYAPGNDMKELNRQLVSVFNFLITVGGAFAFGYKATEYTFYGFSNIFALQLIAGLTLATVVFFADLYFLLRES